MINQRLNKPWPSEKIRLLLFSVCFWFSFVLSFVFLVYFCDYFITVTVPNKFLENFKFVSFFFFLFLFFFLRIKSCKKL